MDSKFYVSLKAARLLKEKGYNEEVELFYNTLGELLNVSDLFCCDVADNTQMAKYGFLSAPTKAEAIDWLESKGIIIGVKPYTAISFSYFILIDRKSSYDVIETNECFSTRLEAEEEAIIKALGLL